MLLLFLENKLKALSYVALPRLFPVSYYFRPGSDGVKVGYPERGGWEGGGGGAQAGGGGGGGGGRKAFRQAGKLKKHFGYQTLAALAPTPSVCVWFSFLFFSLSFYSILFFFFYSASTLVVEQSGV